MKTMKTMQTKTAVEAVFSFSPVTSRRIAALRVGERLRQGDIYITRVKDDQPRGAPWGSRQVAVGNTIGSRHIAVGDLDVFAGVLTAVTELLPGFDSEQRTACCGPVIVARSTWVLEHPEHPHHEVMQDGGVATYQITYQWDSRTMAAVRD